MEFLKSRAFPSFYKEYAPKLLEFFGAWVDWLNEEKNSAYIIDHLSSENDIDESIEAYKTHLRNELIVDFPEEISSDLKLLLKNIFYLYNSKSSIESYEFLFRCLFNASAQISYPKNNVLRLSDGRWYIPKYIKCTGSTYQEILDNFDSYYSLMIKGNWSNSSGYIKKIEIYSFDNGESFDTSLLLEDVSGDFLENEPLSIIYPNTGEILDNLDLNIEKYAIGTGKWNGTFGFLDSDMYIQDSYFYQDFSYIIKSEVPVSKWKSLVKKILHPAGLQLFANLEAGGGGTGETDEKYITKELNPLDFLRFWHIIFKLFIFETPVSLGLSTWSYRAAESILIGSQSHSETPDYWLFEGNYISRDGINDIKVKDFNNCFNRSSVLLFKNDGTLINPDIIRWNDFTFTDDISTLTIYGITLHPDSHVICGDFTGNAWRPFDTSENVKKNYLVFVTNSNDVSNKKIEYLNLSQKYENFTPYDQTIYNSNLNSIVMTPVLEVNIWRNLTINDFITINRRNNEIFDRNSLIKIPDPKIVYDEEYQAYKFLDTVYENEKIVVYNYSDADIDEYYYLDNPEIKQINLKKATYKEYVVAFIDGKFSQAFDVIKDKIYLRATSFTTAEFYILSRIEASRKSFQEYANDKKFTYNNARTLPYMYYNMYLNSLDVIDYHNLVYTPKNAFATIFWLNWLNNYETNFKPIEQLLMMPEVQNVSNTLDEILERNYNTNDAIWNKYSSEYIPESNKNSSLVFSSNGKYIDPDNINWFTYKVDDSSLYNKPLYNVSVKSEKPICKFSLNGESSHNYAEYIAVENLNSNSLVYNKINYSVKLEDLKETDFIMRDTVLTEFSAVNSSTAIRTEIDINSNTLVNDLKFRSQSAIGNLSSYSYVSSGEYYNNLGLYDIEDNVETIADGVQKLQDTPSDSIVQYSFESIPTTGHNFFAFVDGKKIVDSNITLSKTSYIFNSPITGNVILVNYGKNYIKSYYYGNSKTITVGNTKKEFILVFIDGYLNTSYKYDGNTITLNESPVSHYEIYILNNYDYYKLSKSVCNYNGYFRFTNNRKSIYTISNYILDILKEMECITTLKRIDTLLSYNTSIISNALTYFKFSTNSDEQCVIPTYNTLDNILYYGETLEFNNISERTINEYQLQTNRESTIIFDKNGYLIDPKKVNWGDTTFKEKIDTDKITVVVLNPSHPQTNSVIKNVSTTLEYTLQDDELITSNELVFIDNKKVYKDLYTISNNTYTFNSSLIDSSKTEYSINIFEYNSNDIEKIIRYPSFNGRFIDLQKVGVLKNNLLIFRSGLQTSDYYISANTLCFNKQVSNESIEVYMFKPYSYLFIEESFHNKKYKQFIPKNIKRLSLYHYQTI